MLGGDRCHVGAGHFYFERTSIGFFVWQQTVKKKKEEHREREREGIRCWGRNSKSGKNNRRKKDMVVVVVVVIVGANLVFETKLCTKCTQHPGKEKVSSVVRISLGE